MENYFQRKQFIDYRYFVILGGILLCICMIVIVARAIVNNQESKESIPAVSKTVFYSETEGFNPSEQRILEMLLRQYGGTEPSSIETGLTEYLYYDCLRDYFCRYDYQPGKTDMMELENLIQARDDIFGLEQEVNLGKMSLDARDLIIYIDKRIYELCGLSITFTAGNQIEQIWEASGNTLYQLVEQPQQSTLQIDAILIVTISILLLFIICIAISRKNKIFVKEVDLSGFDEKEYA